MTSQMHPLEMGVPLYPFSHSGIFPIPKYNSNETTGAPLPDSSTFEESSTPNSLGGIVNSPPIAGMAVPMHHPSVSPQLSGDALGWRSQLSTSPANRRPTGHTQSSQMTYHQ